MGIVSQMAQSRATRNHPPLPSNSPATIHPALIRPAVLALPYGGLTKRPNSALVVFPFDLPTLPSPQSVQLCHSPAALPAEDFAATNTPATMALEQPPFTPKPGTSSGTPPVVLDP